MLPAMNKLIKAPGSIAAAIQLLRNEHLDIASEAIVGAFGLPPGKAYTSIKGDPSLRETVALRPRQESRIDRQAAKVLDACAWLLRRSGCYAIYIGFNSSEVRTESIFNPVNYEIPDAEALLQDGYLERHFVKVPYSDKMKIIRKTRKAVQKGELRKYLPMHWRTLIDQERKAWQPLEKIEIARIMSAFSQLRTIDGFYLRNAAVSLSQNIVRASFNCDGTYIVDAAHFPQFVDDTIS